jgi:hypothetical protein
MNATAETYERAIVRLLREHREKDVRIADLERQLRDLRAATKDAMHDAGKLRKMIYDHD